MAAARRARLGIEQVQRLRQARSRARLGLDRRRPPRAALRSASRSRRGSGRQRGPARRPWPGRRSAAAATRVPAGRASSMRRIYAAARMGRRHAVCPVARKIAGALQRYGLGTHPWNYAATARSTSDLHVAGRTCPSCGDAVTAGPACRARGTVSRYSQHLPEADSARGSRHAPHLPVPADRLRQRDALLRARSS